MEPPSYDDAIKLDPAALLPLTKSPLPTTNSLFLINTTQTEAVPRPSSSLYNPEEAAVISVENICEQTCHDTSVANEKKINSYAKSLPSTHEISR